LNLFRSFQQDGKQTVTVTTGNYSQSSTSGLSNTLLASNKGTASNVLSGNFVHAGKNESQYLAATKNAYAMNRQVDASSMLNVLASILPESMTDAAFWYGDDKMAQAKALKDSTESNAQNLQDVREDIDRKAEEAQSQAAQGESSQTASPNGDAGDTASQDGDAGQGTAASSVAGGDAAASQTAGGITAATPGSAEVSAPAQVSGAAAVSATVGAGMSPAVPAPQDAADAALAQSPQTPAIDLFV
jgi:hypothetical protein